MAADNLASYGSLARFRDVERLHKVADFTVIGASGDISDFQYVKHLLDSQMYELEYFYIKQILNATRDRNWMILT
jgi:20S proteasome subunit beta 7